MMRKSTTTARTVERQSKNYCSRNIMRTQTMIFSIVLVLGLVLWSPCEADIYSEMATCACNLLYQPVCASNNETYSNECVLKCATETPTGRRIGLHKIKDGHCNEEL
ncbi:hypothetical protein AND_009124 [Anopheles darlingi]|uniref:Kazal-like domain-containing protein n=1 Tax=Anopheles darlingi TaxID=43151 RepID=W5J940_ANODA|nr:hypothetical protein AND_009124 [Anopheles darlingi]